MAEAVLNMQQSQQPTVLVLGTGLTAASCARYFSARGVTAVFADSRQQPPGWPAVMSVMPEACLLTGGLPDFVPEGIQTIVVSPGLPLSKILLDAARSAGVPVVSDIDLFLAEEAGSVLLVTGSNGKSTVTALVNHLLCAAGMSSVAGGNLGTPALDLLDEPHDAAVLELSSFQLERSKLPKSSVATVLNLAVDHLDQHGSLDAYRDAKLRIYDCCELAVVNRAEPDAMPPENANTVSFGLDSPGEGHWGVADGRLVFGDTVVMSVSEIPLVGQHNLQNVLAAFAMAHAYGVGFPQLREGVRSFSALPHRMQRVPTADGVNWINDSKATNEAAAAASIRSTSDPLILIAGGDGKGSGFSAVADALQNRAAQVLVFGKDALTLRDALSPVVPVKQVADLESAVAAAYEKAFAGTTVLLAPACASLDMFSNYAERGERFASLVAEKRMTEVQE
ncbi:MAG: UDP-N-acetylmuramoylalanine--D-glutamate ligase [Gammaproteobacteria bacterium]|jgi:UDP-N-acetylmuramoylalanine--D-glutamate ligase